MFLGELVGHAQSLAKGHQGVVYRALHLEKQLGIELDVQLEHSFAVIFPPDCEYTDNSAVEESGNAVVELAADWSSGDSQECARLLARYERQIACAGHVCPQFLGFFS